jgi:hypothetical protein
MPPPREAGWPQPHRKQSGVNCRYIHKRALNSQNPNNKQDCQNQDSAHFGVTNELEHVPAKPTK